MRSEPEDKEHILAKRSSVILGLTMQELEADGCHCEDGCEVAVLLVVLIELTSLLEAPPDYILLRVLRAVVQGVGRKSLGI